MRHSELKDLLSYDPATGNFTWLVSRGKVKAGTPAGYLHHSGYVLIGINGKSYLAQRLAWFYMTGSWPKGEIDHKDTIRSNNAWLNLREASVVQNRLNQSKGKNNTSGVKGVYWCNSSGKWKTQLRLNNKSYTAGSFDNLEDAQLAIQAKRQELHGEFANHG